MALASSLSLTGILLLVVDDEPDARAMTTALLGEHGALVTTVATAAEAWPLLTATERPRVLICDISLPDEDGYRLLTRLRQWEQENKTAALPALALTALSTFHDRMHALQAGFQMHVAKPVDPEELLLVLQSLLDRARMTGAAADA